jgi:RNA polymerase sigma factor (sigma-70 family)
MSGHTHAHHFPNTRWTIVAQSANADEGTRRKALVELCELYWPPVYAYVRSKGNSPHDAEDITQGFFEELLSHDNFAKADAAKGKLRSFLLASVNNYITNQWKKASRQKRGGGKAVFSLDIDDPELRFHTPEPADPITPDVLYERQWALTLLEHALGDVLGVKYETAGKGALFDALKPALTPDVPMASYAELATQLDLSKSALKVAIHRLRQRYGKLLRENIADTLGPGEDVDTELQHLLSVF